MLFGLYARVYISIYAYMQGIYTYIELGKHIYRSYIYMFSMFIYLYYCIMGVTYVKMGTNWCKCMFCCTSMLPPTKRVALDPVQQS